MLELVNKMCRVEAGKALCILYAYRYMSESPQSRSYACLPDVFKIKHNLL